MNVSSVHWLDCEISGATFVHWVRSTLPLLVLLIAAPAATADETKAETAKAEATTQVTEKTEPAKVETAATVAEKVEAAKKAVIRMIGATALVTEMSTGLPLPARVDTGATCCSIHCEKLEIKDADPDPKVNIGKRVRFLIESPEGEKQGEWIEAKIIDHVKVRTAEHEDERYKVRLKLKVKDVEKKVLVTLNDRDKMKYPVLLGRNFLRDDFLVNVALDGEK